MKSPALDEKVVWRKSMKENKERHFLRDPAINEELVGIAEDENCHNFTLKLAFRGLIFTFLQGAYTEKDQGQNTSISN